MQIVERARLKSKARPQFKGNKKPGQR